MRVLIYGGGAREHALAWKISQSNILSRLFLAKPNDGFKHLGEEILFTDFENLIQKSISKDIDLVIIGPEQPLVDGLTDMFKKNSILVFGVDKYWAQLEGSKSFAKSFMSKHSIDTAQYKLITNANDIDNSIEQFQAPYVIKADGLCAGKGVFITESKVEAKTIIKEYLEGKYGDSSKKVVIEEFLDGEELSLMSIWDGKTLLPFNSARDYKKLKEGNKGLNTGGMGSYCPVSLHNKQKRELSEYVNLLQNALQKECADFTGVIYSGLILTKKGFKVLEYNVRFGDPEIQSLLMHMENDLLEVIIAALNKQLDIIELKWKQGTSACVVVASEGYPINPKKNTEISGLNSLESQVFFAGVKYKDKKLLSNGGRVLSVCYTSDNPFDTIYKDINKIKFKDKIFRTDIGE